VEEQLVWMSRLIDLKLLLPLSACQTIFNVIGGLLADRCQVKKFFLDEGILGLFGKLPIHRCLLP